MVEANAAYPLVAVTSDGSTTMAWADIDGDGDKDLLTGQASGSLTYYRNDQVWSSLSLTTKGVLMDPELLQRALDVAIDGNSNFVYVLSEATLETAGTASLCFDLLYSDDGAP